MKFHLYKFYTYSNKIRTSEIRTSEALQAGIEFKKNLRVRFGKYGGLKLEYF